MSTNDERIRAIDVARELLNKLGYSKPGTWPIKQLREEARATLRHYPSKIEFENFLMKSLTKPE